MSGPPRAAPPARPAVPPRPGSARRLDDAAPPARLLAANEETPPAAAAARPSGPSPLRPSPALPPPPPPPRPAGTASATTSAATSAATSLTATASTSFTTSRGAGAIVLDAAVARDLAQLSQLDLESGTAAIELVLDFLELPEDEAVVHEALGALSARAGADRATVDVCARGLVSVLGDALRDGRRPGQVQAAFEEAGCGAAISAAAGELWAARLAGLLRARSRRVLHVNRLVDCDWQLGLTLATNDIDSLGAPFLQLSLDVDQGNGELRRELVELSLPRLNELLAAVEQARAQLDALDMPHASRPAA
jgi:hypothetical protein